MNVPKAVLSYYFDTNIKKNILNQVKLKYTKIWNIDDIMIHFQGLPLLMSGTIFGHPYPISMSSFPMILSLNLAYAFGMQEII